MEISTLELVSLVSIALLAGAFAIYVSKTGRKLALLQSQLQKQPPPAPKPDAALVLGAYERLTLLAERCKLNALITRYYNPQFSVADLQQVLLQAIREEFDHNITQQLYVAPQVWEGITKMKDQNAFLIRQMAAMMPPEASALDLTKKLLDFEAENPEATLNQMVLQAIRFEAGKLINA